MTEQCSSRERNAFHVAYLSDKIPEAVFHGQAVKTAGAAGCGKCRPHGNPLQSQRAPREG